MIVVLLSGCSFKSEKRELSQHNFKGLSFKVSDEWTYDEEWEDSEYNETGMMRFYNEEATKNVVSFDLKEISASKNSKKSKKDLIVDKLSFDNYDGMGSAFGGKWEKSGDIEYYVENVKYSAYNNERKGKNILVPTDDYKSCYVILTLCEDKGLMNNLVEDLSSSFGFEE